MTVETIANQASWVMESSCTRMAVTQTGGHMAPVTFRLEDGREVQPYHLSPWQGEEHSVPAGQSEAILRGDFFCMPFGGGAACNPHENHTPHGQTAGERWTLTAEQHHERRHDLRLHMEMRARRGSVQREFSLIDGQTVVYDRTVIQGFAGPVTLGHHAVLRLPLKEGKMRVSIGSMKLGMTYPEAFGDPAKGEYQSLRSGVRFSDLARVTSFFVDTPETDCTAFPKRAGFSDLLQVGAEPGEVEPAWTAAVNQEERYLWFALRDRRVLPSTLLWIENKGRHAPPWSGRNVSLGLEDVCSYFDKGIAASVQQNPFSGQGVRTHHMLSDEQSFTVSYIQGVVGVPEEFDQVRSVRCDEHETTFVSESGLEVSTAVESGYVMGAELVL